MDQATTDSIANVGIQIYDSLRATLEPALNGKYIVIDVDTREYEIDDDGFAAAKRARAKRPNPRLYIVRIGIPFHIFHAIPRRAGATQ